MSIQIIGASSDPNRIQRSNGAIYRVAQFHRLNGYDFINREQIAISDLFTSDHFVRLFLTGDDRTYAMQFVKDELLLIDLSESKRLGQLYATRVDPQSGQLSSYLRYLTPEGEKRSTDWIRHAVFEEYELRDEAFVDQNGVPVPDVVSEADHVLEKLLTRPILFADNRQKPAFSVIDIAGEYRLVGTTVPGLQRQERWNLRSRVAVIAEANATIDLAQALRANFAHAYLTTRTRDTYRVTWIKDDVFLIADRLGVIEEVAVEKARVKVGSTFEPLAALNEPVARIALESRETFERRDAFELTNNQHDLTVESFDRAFLNLGRPQNEVLGLF